MRFETTQHMKLGQQMKLAPRMIQSMEILQMPMMALQERIDQELESNIALELVEPGGDEKQLAEDRADAAREESLNERELVVGDADHADADDWQRLSTLESTYSEAFENEYSSKSSRARQMGERDRKMDAMANVAARGAGLTEQLQSQWSFAEVDPDIAAIGEVLIGYIDDEGMLTVDVETVRSQNPNMEGIPQGASAEQVEELFQRTVHELQHWLDPPGVAARDMRECLLLQIDALQSNPEDDHDWTNTRLIIAEHYDDLLENRLPKIARASGLSLEAITEAMELMRKLRLSPARDLVDADVPHIVPDVVVEYDEDSDQYVASLVDGVLPALRVSRQYEKMAKDRSQPKETREFVGNSVRNATWLIDSISQRKNTMLRVVNVVLARQRDYFDHGPQHLKPLPMIEVADQLGIHVGTVSRAVADKWLATPRGLVALRKFFSGGTETESGENMSWEAVKATLKEIIDGEDKAHPLSDEALARELKARGIEIARRTVVKYRSQMNIPPARRRRVYSAGNGASS